MNLGNLDPFPRLIFATVTLTTNEVVGISVNVSILIETAGVEVMKKVEVSVGGVKKVVVVWERVPLTVVPVTLLPCRPEVKKESK